MERESMRKMYESSNGKKWVLLSEFCIWGKYSCHWIGKTWTVERICFRKFLSSWCLRLRKYFIISYGNLELYGTEHEICPYTELSNLSYKLKCLILNRHKYGCTTGRDQVKLKCQQCQRPMQWQGICRTEYIQMRLKGMWCLILLFPNQPHIREIPCWLCIWSCLILSIWARDIPKQRGKKNSSLHPVCELIYPISMSFLSVKLLWGENCVYMCIYIYVHAYMHIYVCIHINIYNTDCINANFVGGAKEETPTSLVPHNPHCSEGLEVCWVHSVWGQWYSPLLSISNRWRELIIHWFQLWINCLTSTFCCTSGASTVGGGRKSVG